MWSKNWRDTLWHNLDQPWDIIIVGGGITGAGLLREATQLGLRCLLVEATDFSFGTSSRSSKLVHGGFRYLANRQYAVTRESVQEREWMLQEANLLVTKLPLLLVAYKKRNLRLYRLGLAIYDLFGHKWDHRALSKNQLLQQCSAINPHALQGGYEYYDAQVDDSRLVLRIIREAVRQGATAINYARAESLLRDAQGQVCGVRLVDTATPAQPSVDVHARVIINATGPWSDALREQLGAQKKLRKLRGSHILFSHEKLPITKAISLTHPKDQRNMFLLPWEGASMIGTTDVDHDPALEKDGAEPFASASEIQYMLEALHATLPGINLTQKDILSTFAGLRPIVFDGDTSPSKASRKHVILVEDGLLTVTGGKLTIFRLMANETLLAAANRLPNIARRKGLPRFFDPLPSVAVFAGWKISMDDCARLLGRYGADVADLIQTAREGDFTPVGASNVLWAELQFAARAEGVVHLDDLLLRRVRLGLLLPEGGKDCLPQMQAVLQPILGWDDSRWQAECARYLQIWESYYSPAPTGQPVAQALDPRGCDQLLTSGTSAIARQLLPVP